VVPSCVGHRSRSGSQQQRLTTGPSRRVHPGGAFARRSPARCASAPWSSYGSVMSRVTG
jgi:hypothetical protein